VRPGSATKAPRRPAKPKAAPPESAPVWEAYRSGYARVTGEDPPRNAATNSIIVRLIRELGAEEAKRLVEDVFATPEAAKRYPSIQAISKDVASVRAFIVEAQKPPAMTEAQINFARVLCGRHPKHRVVLLIKAEKRAPTLDEFEELVAHDKQGAPKRGVTRQMPAGPGDFNYRDVQNNKEIS
jgi:hypothetical protein